MCKVICFVLQKGGVAKTTSCINVASCLAEKDYRVLVVDVESQANATTGLGLKTGDSEYTLYDVIRGREFAAYPDIDVTDAIVNINGNLDLLVGSEYLATADSEFNGQNRNYIVKEIIEPIHDSYDFILIDASPKIDWGMLNAIYASDYIVVPCAPGLFECDSLLKLSETVEMAKKYCNQKLEVAGILLTRNRQNTIVSRECKAIIDMIAKQVDFDVFKTWIPESEAVKQATIAGKPVTQMYPLSKPAIAYRDFTDELLVRLPNKQNEFEKVA